MSQHDFEILTSDANTGITFRAEVNAALQALASLSSGTGNPARTYPYQIKVDTSASPAVVYMRKSDNSAWVRFGYVNTSGQLIIDNAANADVVRDSSILPNGSFEKDSDNDGIPDSWTRTLYPGGSGGFETTNPIHGARAYKFIHPGGAGNGGGFLESDFIEVTPLKRYLLGFVLWSSVAEMRNVVWISYFAANKVHINTIEVYNSTANPTSPMYFIRGFTPVVNARYIKITLAGGHPDINVAGTTYFDFVTLEPRVDNFACNFTFPEAYTNSPTFIDVASTTFTIPANLGIPVCLSFSADVRIQEYGNCAYQRFRIGSEYSNVGFSYHPLYEKNPYYLVFNPANTTTGTSITIYMQLTPGANYTTAYGRKQESIALATIL